MSMTVNKKAIILTSFTLLIISILFVTGIISEPETVIMAPGLP